MALLRGRPLQPEVSRQGRPQPTTGPVGAGRVKALTGRPILLDDVSTWPNYVDTLRGARSELCVPVLHQGEKLAEGSPQAVRADRRVQDVYLGEEGADAALL